MQGISPSIGRTRPAYSVTATSVRASTVRETCAAGGRAETAVSSLSRGVSQQTDSNREAALRTALRGDSPLDPQGASFAILKTLPRADR